MDNDSIAAPTGRIAVENKVVFETIRRLFTPRFDAKTAFLEIVLQRKLNDTRICRSTDLTEDGAG